LEEAFLDEEVDDAGGGLKALARNVDDEDTAVEDVGEVGLITGVGAKRVFKLRVGEARERGLDRPVDAAALFLGILCRDGGFVIDRALEPEACLLLTVVGRSPGALYHYSEKLTA